MTQSEQPLYPKLSSIYNKIMQLAIAIVLIIILLNILLFTHQKNNTNIEQHFKKIADEYSSQASDAVAVLFESDNKEGLQTYIDNLADSEMVNDVHFYDHSGQVLFNSTDGQSIRALYGIEEHKIDNSDKFIPFIEEVRGENLIGYLRMTLEKKQLVASLDEANDQSSEMFRIMLALAGIVGFLLTRGLNRFSRQGYRLAKEK